ncbi:MAG TPA: efflux RND transporter periplasmic adaptor subunit [Sphingomicrobium sp.]|nr:efflux RND transporter periplasmic adaptor subunit [Sphingomicrobium sp.]
MQIVSPRVIKAGTIATLLLLAACGQADSQNSDRSQGPVGVGFVVVQPATVSIEQDLPGRVTAYQIAEVRPQVSGVVLRRLFEQGTMVRQGQPLYEIDPRIYQTEVNQAAANLRSAQASEEAATAREERYRSLAKSRFVSRQAYDDVLAQARQARAAVSQNAAALQEARINLRFTRVPAPISGRVGASNVTEGALVTASQNEALTTITRLDPVYVDVQQSAPELLALRRSLARGGAIPTVAQVRLTLPDGSDYGYTGTVQFTEVVVNPDTGSVTLRASFPNAQSILLPGMFVKARFAQAIDRTAFLVPQPAISRDARGNATLWVVGPGNTAVQRTVVADRTSGANWVVTQGLAPGERVVTEGVGKLKEGARVKPVRAGTPQRVQAPAGAARTGR